MNSPKPTLTKAYRLGKRLEGFVDTMRRDFARQKLQADHSALPDDAALFQDRVESHWHEESLRPFLDPVAPFMPDELVRVIQEIDPAKEATNDRFFGSNRSLHYNAIAGLIGERMSRGATWYALQLGRTTQRTLHLVRAILAGLNESQLPNDAILQFLALRLDCPIPRFHEGTHLWKVHYVFTHILKEPKHPKSMVSNLERIESYVRSLPVPEGLKKDHESIRMAENRISNDLAFVDIHELIGDDPEDHFSQITDFFDRQHQGIRQMTKGFQRYFEVFDSYMDELDEDERFDFSP